MSGAIHRIVNGSMGREARAPNVTGADNRPTFQGTSRRWCTAGERDEGSESDRGAPRHGDRVSEGKGPDHKAKNNDGKHMTR